MALIWAVAARVCSSSTALRERRPINAGTEVVREAISRLLSSNSNNSSNSSSTSSFYHSNNTSSNSRMAEVA